MRRHSWTVSWFDGIVRIYLNGEGINGISLEGENQDATEIYEQAKNNFEISRTLTQEFTIESMIDGKVYSLLKEPGELVTQQTPVALLGDAIAFYLELRVDEYDIIKIKQNQEVYITMDSYTGEVFEATVTRINPIMNERDKSFTIEAEFTKSPKLLYPFLTVEANILIQYKEKVVTIPRNYLVDDNSVLLKNGSIKEVIIGLKDYQKAEIVKGLTETDEIIKPIPWTIYCFLGSP